MIIYQMLFFSFFKNMQVCEDTVFLKEKKEKQKMKLNNYSQQVDIPVYITKVAKIKHEKLLLEFPKVK